MLALLGVGASAVLVHSIYGDAMVIVDETHSLRLAVIPTKRPLASTALPSRLSAIISSDQDSDCLSSLFFSVEIKIGHGT